MKPDEIIGNMDKYIAGGRGSQDAAARQSARQIWQTDRATELMDRGASEADAATQAARELKSLDVTHALDLVAGGDGSISGLGNSSANRSIGSAWKGDRVNALRNHAEEAKKSGKKMDVKLRACDEGES